MSRVLETKPDVVCVCVSIVSFSDVIKQLVDANKNKHVLEDLLVVDVLSVKLWPKNILLEYLPLSTSILCTHPMFGPQSALHTWVGRAFMYERVRLHTHTHTHTYTHTHTFYMCM
eukprot:GHVR01076688.1.p1 GENE.GHVR01076688.1~~GHVR01076688.1.p1  ORF type:complete len:115 (+),score=57.85 GHVR01076688.1:381-725(+)